MKNLLILFAFLGTLSLAACGGSDNNAMEEDTTATTETTEPAETTPPAMEEPGTIVDIASDNGNFTTLVAAVQAAELVETLKSNGPFTVFAPVDAAFEKLPAGTVAGLLNPESKEALTSILTYHVVSGEYTAKDVIDAINKNNGSFMIPTVQEGTLTATLENGKVVLTDKKGNKSTVVMTDVEASNGVIHAIDTVVMPG
ncbi:fasciclin domain-containing protein [Flavilitoribacter nigricans]|uniref:Beta-Ig-H3/fasciclin n=1 Tax=Flavilitoribacter nigricans (strain ATCC 23147 / DSM 23189 / NBRC 102662 / NCIMB 1420 / SS-2) TaxID=1122177 RepID=A0A2D0NH94_FLAN2|nr:fasciclin domain-containing protein [Flavilitoribacter nigricans]PHN07862.1 beta-Ig-H3/fasciclin [Flavilitoribacter nigricans DSM 23189 = NBRC 102662]